MYFLNREIGPKCEPYFVAEISGNHEGDLKKLLNLIELAHKSGADAVKIQTYKPKELTYWEDGEDFIVKEGPWKDKSLFELYTNGSLPCEYVQKAFKFAREKSIPLFSSVYGEKSLEFLENLGCPAYKIASFENNDLTLINKVLSKNKPTIISTGCIESNNYFSVCDYFDNIDKLIFMHCISAYPTQLYGANLNQITIIKDKTTKIVGFSDHTIGTKASEYAVALGANIIEKHFGLSYNIVDGAFSTNQEGFKRLKQNCLQAYQAVYGDKDPSEKASYQFKRSLYAVKDIKEGDLITNENVKSIRPSYGMEPNNFPLIEGLPVVQDIKAGTALKKEMIYTYRLTK